MKSNLIICFVNFIYSLLNDEIGQNAVASSASSEQGTASAEGRLDPLTPGYAACVKRFLNRTDQSLIARKGANLSRTQL